MTDIEIARLRIFNQHIAVQMFTEPAGIVQYMGAVQAQDYAGAKWAVSIRLQNGSDAAVDKAMAGGSIIRIHVLRPTWHFVVPEDLRWMLELTAPRIRTLSASKLRQLQLDSLTLKSSHDVLTKALEGGKQLNRLEIMAVLNQAGIKTDEERFIHLLMQAELDMVICSGGRQGKQFTYALFDDRVPKGKSILKDEALAELIKRYFISRGPATLHDFAWWSGLTLTDAKAGLETVKTELTNFKTNDTEYWMGKELPDLTAKSPAYLLPAYDEFAVAYADRKAAINPKHLKEARHVIFDPSIVIDNQVVGTWKRTVNKNSAKVILNPFGKLNKGQVKAIEKATGRYKSFLK